MPTPSELIRLHISGAGNGFELDDLMSAWTGGIYDEISDRIVAIHDKYKNDVFRIGTTNPDSYEELEQLASELEERGY